MTRIEAGALRLLKEPCEVQDVVGTALEQLGHRLDGREVVVDMPPGLPMLPLDFALMAQVFVNLVDNALKYSPAGSPVEVHAHASEADLVMQVADRGVGIPPEDLARVFDKFYRVQRPGSVSGTGLGLSICKGIVEAHGGSIGAENRSGGGTVITISMPLGASADSQVEENP
jgi:two-component system sensor histidine kinase KdpD